MTQCKWTLAGYIFVFLPSLGLASTENKVSEADLIGRLELAVPDNPAFIALGVTPEKVIKPGSTRELALALLQGVDANGNLQSGLAVEAAPFVLAKGKTIDLATYRNSSIVRALYSLQVSFATTSGQSNADKADRNAIGVRFTPWTQGDKRMNTLDFKVDGKTYTSIIECFDTKIGEDPEPSDLDLNTGEGKERETDPKIEKAAKACIKAAEKMLWNASSWDVGASVYDADNETINETGYSLWTSLALRMGSSGQFISSARYNQDALVPDINGDNMMEVQDGYVLGARLRWGDPKAAILVEGSYSDLEYSSIDVKDQYYDMMVGGEIYLMEGLWLHLGYGRRGGSDLPNNDENYLSGQVRWAMSGNSLRD